MPTLQQIRYLVALSETRHFRRAAEACHVTQPTLSTGLREMEARLGAQLIERSRGRVILTPVGEDVVAHGKAMLRSHAEMHAIAKRGAAPLSDTIRLGTVPSLGPYLLPLVLPDLHVSHPALKLYVREEAPGALLDRLEAGDLDLLVFPLPAGRDDLAVRPLFEEPLLAVVPQDHPLAREEAVLLSDLRGETLLALQSEPRLYNQVRGIAEAHGAVLSHDYEGTSLDTLRQMVSMGMGVTLLPSLYVKSEVTKRDIVTARPLRGVPPVRLIGLVWRKGTAKEDEYRMLAARMEEVLSARAPEVSLVA